SGTEPFPERSVFKRATGLRALHIRLHRLPEGSWDATSRAAEFARMACAGISYQLFIPLSAICPSGVRCLISGNLHHSMFERNAFGPPREVTPRSRGSLAISPDSSNRASVFAVRDASSTCGGNSASRVRSFETEENYYRR